MIEVYNSGRERWRGPSSFARSDSRGRLSPHGCAGPLPTLPPGGQAGGEAWRKLCLEDAVLRGFQIVGCAVEMNDLRVGVEQGESGAPVAVARLADRARIDQVTCGSPELEGDGLGLADGAILRAETVGARAVDEKSALQMGVPKKSQGDSKRNQRSQGIA